MIIRSLTVAASAALFAVAPGCGPKNLVPPTLGETATSLTYIPVPSQPANWYPGDSTCKRPGARQKKLLDALPDVTSRIGITRYSADGKVTFASTGIGAKGDVMDVVVDYALSDVTTFILDVVELDKGQRRYYQSKSGMTGARSVSLPVVVGLGARMTASLTVLKGSVNVSGLTQIAIEANAERVSGSMVVQSLGVQGESVSTSIPISSKTEPAAIENAIVSMATMRTKAYSDEVVTSPRLLGFYAPFGMTTDEITSVYSIIAGAGGVAWPGPCEVGLWRNP